MERILFLSFVLLDEVVSLDVRKIFSVLATPLIYMYTQYWAAYCLLKLQRPSGIEIHHNFEMILPIDPYSTSHF